MSFTEICRGLVWLSWLVNLLHLLLPLFTEEIVLGGILDALLSQVSVRNSLWEVDWMRMDAVGTLIGRSETVCAILTSCDSLVVDLNVGFRGSYVRQFHSTFSGSVWVLSCGWHRWIHSGGLCLICSKQEVWLPNILAIILGLNFALNHLAEVVLSQSLCSHRPIVNLISAKIVVRNAIHSDTLFLIGQRLGVHLAKGLSVVVWSEEGVVLVCGGLVVYRSFITHLEIGYSHGQGVSNVCLLLVGQLVWGVSMARWSLVLELGRSRLAWKGEIGVARLLN